MNWGYAICVFLLGCHSICNSMNSLKDTAFKINPYMKINFKGGDLSLLFMVNVIKLTSKNSVVGCLHLDFLST